MVRFFHKSRDTNPNRYPSNTPINIGIENKGEISMQTNPQILFEIYEVIQARLLVWLARSFSRIASDHLTIKTGLWV